MRQSPRGVPGAVLGFGADTGGAGRAVGYAGREAGDRVPGRI